MILPTGIGGSTAEDELAQLSDMTTTVHPISEDERRQRLANAQAIMRQEGIAAIYLNAGTNLYYFTGLRWYASERLVGAILPAEGDVVYIAPAFELGTIQDYLVIPGQIHCWEEHESPYALVGDVLSGIGVHIGKIGIDEATPFFISNGIQLANQQYLYVDAKPVTAGCRSCKSQHEIALIQRAMDMTLTVHKAAARILRCGISAQEVVDFINEAHKRVGAPAGSSFCIVLFGVDSSFPHGVKQAKSLEKDDVVLIDTGCQLHGYNADITRTYVYGQASPEIRRVWAAEKAAQAAAFAAADIGVSCGEVDQAARAQLVVDGFADHYQLPGLPHRTGHGIGLDIHEWPYLVKDNPTKLTPGMCFSNEPMICVPEQFGIRLEDHFYMTSQGAKWFTTPSLSIDDPFGINQNN